MAITYPITIDTLSNPASTDNLNSPSHADQHSDANDAVEALEAKVGADSSAVVGSLDYKLSNTSSSNPGHKHTLASGATDITSSKDELNVLDGITASTAELNQLDDNTFGGTTSGDVVTIDDTQTLTNKTVTGLVFAGIDNSSDAFNPGDADKHDVTGWSVSVTVPTGTHNVLVELGAMVTYGTINGANLFVYRDATQVTSLSGWIRAGQTIANVGSVAGYVDSGVAAGTYTYKVSLSASGSTSPDITVESKYIKCTIIT